MKTTIKKIIGPLAVALVTAFSLTSCYETRYVHHNNHHTRGWYDRRHTAYPAGVSFEVEERGRR